MNGYVYYIGKYMFVTSLADVLYAALLSFVLTWTIMSIIKIRRLVRMMPQISKGAYELGEIMERCHSLFPIENIEFGGNAFKRGMAVKVTLSNKKSFLGSFVGKNSQDIICVVTPGCIITGKLKEVESLEAIDIEPKA